MTVPAVPGFSGTASLLLAVDIGDFVWVLFVLIAMVSGIINKYKENKAAQELQQRRAQRGRPKQGQLQDEIAQFLEELAPGAGGSRAARSPQPASQERIPTRDRIPSRERTASQDRTASRERTSSRERVPVHERTSSRDRIPSRERTSVRDRVPTQSGATSDEPRQQATRGGTAHQRSSSRGTKRHEHDLDDLKNRHVESAVHDRHLVSHVGEHQPGTLTDSSVEDVTVAQTSGTMAESTAASAMAAAGLPAAAQWLARRDGLASAIVLNEILSPPVSRREKRRR